ncbi:MAG: CRISPR-associated protein Cas4 [Bacillota bacterium]|jgi:CRISPR-associated exonuclease Cas4|nr:CRISPR-associated protein Cas4 [Bacillota bacterium]
MYTEEELIPLSALQHLLYCERRAALVHVEQAWADNVYTVEGSYLHDRADQTGTERRGDLLLCRGLHIKSMRLGLSGRADVVEFHLITDPDRFSEGVRLCGHDGQWAPFPVEYKRGRLRHEIGYEVQLCAQAMSLEETLGAEEIAYGALFFGKTHRRLDIALDSKLRELTVQSANRLHEIMDSGTTPKAVKSAKCDKCSLVDLCMPELASRKQDTGLYLRRVLADMIKKGE